MKYEEMLVRVQRISKIDEIVSGINHFLSCLESYKDDTLNVGLRYSRANWEEAMAIDIDPTMVDGLANYLKTQRTDLLNERVRLEL